MSGLIHLVPLAIAAFVGYLLHRANRPRGWSREQAQRVAAHRRADFLGRGSADRCFSDLAYLVLSLGAIRQRSTYAPNDNARKT
jgi:hypothetical protein